MTDIEKLLAIHEISLLKARYFRFVDTKDWEGLRGLFTPDALIFYPEARDAPDPRDVAIPFIVEALKDAVTVHHGHMPEIEILSATEARAVWAMEDLVHRASGALPGAQSHGFGHYHEEYVWRGEGWLIHRLTLTRLRLSGTATRQVGLA